VWQTPGTVGVANRGSSTHPASSSARAPFTSLCRSNGPTPAKPSDTTMALKWVSDPRGTLCEADSLSTSKCVGENAAWSFEMILPSTGRLSASTSSAKVIVKPPHKQPRAVMARVWKIVRTMICALLATSTAALRTSLASKQRRPANARGNLFVDESCIDCDTCRWMAPATYGRAGTKSYVHKQPEGSDDTAVALAAAVACPTGSIRTQAPEPSMRGVVESYPLPIDAARLPRVFHLGYHAATSFGATPYLLCMPDGTNAMVDAPRFSSKLAKALEARGGVQLLLLTHMDDVADHNRWKP